MIEKLKKNISEKWGQTAVELAVFGAVLIFVIGAIIRGSFSSGQAQHHQLKALRVALKTSYEYSQDIKGQSPSGNRGQNGNASRNSASVIFVEDRLSPASGKYGSTDRQPLMMGGSGMHSRNLFMPVDPGEGYNISRLDVFVNGKHFPFTTAGFRTVDVTGTTLYSRIPNHPAISDWCDDISIPCTGDPANVRFDLAHDGSVVVPVGERPLFAWQWMSVPVGSIDTENGRNTMLDVDGDLYEERILGVSGNTLTIMDYNAGDVDFAQKPPPGFDQDVQMYTLTRRGTYLQIREGNLYLGDQYISTASKKDQVDIIQRVFRLSNNTGRFCSVPDPVAGTPSVLQGNLAEDEVPNPVEACDNCFAPARIELTCMDTTNNIIFIRSRIADLHGRKWVTKTEDDPYISFSSTALP